MGRSPCCDKNGLKKGPWTQEEDSKLMQYIQTHGPGNWRTLPKNAGLQRCGKSCRLRWTNYLRPDIKRGRFSFEEEETIIQLHSILGNKWSAIAARLPGRTDNEIKNYWNTHIRKRLLRMGIDPVTHAPRLDYLDLSSLIGSAQLNLSNLLGLQNIVNPDLFRLLNLLSTGHENAELLSLVQKLQEHQSLSNAQLPNQSLIDHFQTTTQDTSILNQAQLLMEGQIGQFTTNNSGYQNLQEFINQTPSSSLSNAALPNYGYCMENQMGTNALDNLSNAQVIMNNNNNNNNNNNQKFQFDNSVLSTPMSSSSPTPLNSSSGFINSSSTTTDQDIERDSFCSNMLFKFEIPESLNFDDFM